MLALYERMIMLCDGIIDNSGSCLDLIGVKFLSSRMEGDSRIKDEVFNPSRC
jgi:hypothetical protein